MSWVAVGVGAAGIATSLYTSSKQPKQVQPDVYNAYGEKNTANTGAITSRDNIFGTINSDAFQSQASGFADQYLRALQGAASDPRLTAVSDYGMNVLRGDYLTSPVVTRYADQAADSINAAGADNARRVGATFARGGQSFSTGMLQALQAARAAAAQKAATTRSGILSANYQNERALQQASTGIVNDSVQQPLNYLSQMTSAMYQPYQLQAGLTTQLLGNNQVVQPTLMQQPSTMDKVANGVNTAVGLYQLYKGLNTPAAGAGTAPKG